MTSRKRPAFGKEKKPDKELPEVTIQRLQNSLSSRDAVIEQLSIQVRQLEERMKEYKEVMESQQKKIKQLEMELVKEKEKNNFSKSESSNSPPLMKT